MQKSKTRRMKMGLGHVMAKPSWGDSTVTFRTWTGSEFHEAIITIDAPWELAYLRRELDKIEAGWRERLERCK
jgi:hypothetical protein